MACTVTLNRLGGLYGTSCLEFLISTNISYDATQFKYKFAVEQPRINAPSLLDRKRERSNGKCVKKYEKI